MEITSFCPNINCVNEIKCLFIKLKKYNTFVNEKAQKWILIVLKAVLQESYVFKLTMIRIAFSVEWIFLWRPELSYKVHHTLNMIEIWSKNKKI